MLFGRLLGYGGLVWLEKKPAEERGDRFCIGAVVINLRGQLIPIIDLRTRFGMPRAEHTKNTRIVVSEVGTKRVGMVVDSVSEVLRLPLDAIEPAPDMIAGVDTEYIRGVGKVDDRLIILLDLAKVVTGSEKRELESTEVETAA